MTRNAYLCDACGHHERQHHRDFCQGPGLCPCTNFTPGACPTCAGFGCADCFQDAKGRMR